MFLNKGLQILKLLHFSGSKIIASQCLIFKIAYILHYIEMSAVIKNVNQNVYVFKAAKLSKKKLDFAQKL